MRYFRFVLLIVVLWMAALLTVRQFVCIGWVVPIRVASHSMAPTLYGPHAKTICQGCGHLLLTDAAPQAEPAVVDCLNCGDQTSATASAAKLGSRVLVDRWSIRSGIERFDIVALAAEGTQGRQLKTKRVIGMPGEIISLREGDVYADDAIVRKSAHEFSAMAILVHTDRHRRDDTKPRWRGTDKTGWTEHSDGYRWLQPNAPPTDGNRVDWLTYQHQSSAKVVTPRSTNAWIYDDYQYNLAASRALHRVHDLALAAELAWSGDGTLQVRCPTPQGICEMRLVATTSGDLRSIELWLDETLLAQTSDAFSITTKRNRIPILVGYWDRQLICRLGDAEVLRHRFESAPATPTSAETQFALSATEVDEFLVNDLSIWRDLYYFLPDDGPRSSSASVEVSARALAPRLASETYLLLGDNVPQSKDARYGAEIGIVSASQILGIIVPVN